MAVDKLGVRIDSLEVKMDSLEKRLDSIEAMMKKLLLSRSNSIGDPSSEEGPKDRSLHVSELCDP